MQTQQLLQVPPQKDVLTLAEGKKRTHNWRKFISKLYGKGHKQNIPHAIFIPFDDIAELAKLQQAATSVSKPPENVVERIYVVGVRCYFSFAQDESGSGPIGADQYPIEAVLVPVYQTNPRTEGSPEEYEYDNCFPTYDLLVPVPAATDLQTAGDSEAYTIYDITSPCPNLCDEGSALFNG